MSREAKTRVNDEMLLLEELERLRRKVGLGSEVKVKWQPGTRKIKDGRRLLEEVQGNTILVYSENPVEAQQLVGHGFLEWLLNRYTKNYRVLINKFIEVFETLQYENKEGIVEALSRLLNGGGDGG